MNIQGLMITNDNFELILYKNYSNMSHSEFEDFSYKIASNCRDDININIINDRDKRLVLKYFDEIILIAVASI